MNFHWPSFLLGYGAGVASTLLAQRFRPVLTEIASAGFGFFESAATRMAMTREDIDDILAEARARARSTAAEAEEPEAPKPRRRKRTKSAGKRTKAGAKVNGAAPAEA